MLHAANAANRPNLETPVTGSYLPPVRNHPEILSHDQEIRIRSANDTLAEIRRWIRNTPPETYEMYASPENRHEFDTVTFQKVSHVLRSLRNVEMVLPYLTPEQRTELAEINGHYIPVFLNMLEDYEVGPGLQKPILDILSLEGITMDQVHRLEARQNALNLAMIGNDEGAKAIEDIKKGWTRYAQ